MTAGFPRCSKCGATKDYIKRSGDHCRCTLCENTWNCPPRGPAV